MKFILSAILLLPTLPIFSYPYLIQSIQIKNLNHTNQEQVSRNIDFKVGDVISKSLVIQSLWRLNNEEIWQNVDIAVIPQTPETQSQTENDEPEDFQSDSTRQPRPADVIIDVTEKNPWLVILQGWPAITTDRNARQMLILGYIVTQGILDYRIFNLWNKDIDFRFFHNFVSGSQFLKTPGYLLGLNFLDLIRINLDFRRLWNSNWSLKFKGEYGQPLHEHYFQDEKVAVYSSEEMKWKTGLEYKLNSITKLGRFVTFDFYHELAKFRLKEMIEEKKPLHPFVGSHLAGFYHSAGSMITISSRRLLTSKFHFSLKAPFEYTWQGEDLRQGFSQLALNSHFSLNTDLLSVDLQLGYKITPVAAPFWYKNKMATMKYQVNFEDNRVRGYLTDDGLFNEGIYANFQVGLSLTNFASLLLLVDSGYAFSSDDNGRFFMQSYGTGLDLKISPVSNLQLYLLINREGKLTALAGIKKRI